MNTYRKELEAQGYTFCPGKIDHETGIFHFANRPADATHTGDLVRMGFRKVKGGMMEPPKAGAKEVLGAVAGLAALVGFVYLGHKVTGTKLFNKFEL